MSQSRYAPEFLVGDLAGLWSFRFSGYTVAQAAPYRLAGLGWMRITPDGGIAGAQCSAITMLQGQGAKLSTNQFDLSGMIKAGLPGFGLATIHYQPTSGHGLALDGTFALMPGAGRDQIWMVSQGATVSGSGADADELATIEAVRRQ